MVYEILYSHRENLNLGGFINKTWGKSLTVLFLELLITQGAADTPTEVCKHRHTQSG